MAEGLKVPFFYEPRPYQRAAWARRLSGDYDYYFKIWSRQCIAGDTLVWTPDGMKRVDELKYGDSIYSAHIGTNGVEYQVKQVTAITPSPWKKPVIYLGKRENHAGMSYDHPIYYNGTYQELYRVTWGAMDADQRHRLQILCEQYGQSLELGLLQSSTVGTAEAIHDRQGIQDWQRILAGKALPSGWNLDETEGASISSSSFYSESGEQASNKSQGRRHQEQSGRQPDVVHELGESGMELLSSRNETKDDERRMRLRDCRVDCHTEGLAFAERVRGSKVRAIRSYEELYQLPVQWQDLEIEEAVQLYDITVADNHNFFVGLSATMVKNCGKDSDDIQKAMHFSWNHPGTQSAYVGLDNKWIRRNIWDKYLDGRRHWDNYPQELIEIRETQQQIKFLNNPEDKAEALIQFIGFKESESLIGSSYESFYVSELSLYRRGAFDFIMPIWENKAAMGEPLSVNFNFTPRGMNNIAADMLRTYTGEDDPAKWPGAHGRVYVDVVRADQATLADGSKLWTPEALEAVRQRYIRAHGNDNMFRQEFMCEFLAVNAGLVFPGIEVLRKENRFTPFNLRTDKPVYMAWDISSKDKQSDWTAGIVYQYIDGKMFIYDYYEDNRKAVVECVQELAKRPYFHLIRAACLPWDSDRSGSQHSPLEECRQMFPNIQWRKLERTYVADGINRVRKLIPNMLINSDKCDWVMECFESWEYKELSSVDDWAASPKHDRYSHIMDATRYCAEMIEQLPYIRTSDGGPKEMPLYYPAWGDEQPDKYAGVPAWMRPSKFTQKKKPAPNSGQPRYSSDW